MPTSPPPAAPSAGFEPELQRALALQRQAALRVGARLRLAGGALVFVLVLALWRRGDAHWWPYVVPLGAYTLLMALLARATRTRLADAWLGAAQSALDVGVVWAMQDAALPISPHPAGVAGFSLGLFALVVALSGLTLRAGVMALTAALAVLAQGALMREADVAWGSVLVAAPVLALVAAVTHFTAGRVRTLALSLTAAEVERQVQQRRFDEVEQARHTIERMLAEAHEANARLLVLQRDRESLVQLIVHDLRSPLTGVQAYLELLEHQLGRRALPELAQSASEAGTQARRLTAMIADILNVARLEEGRLELAPEPVPAALLLDAVARQVAAVAQLKGVEVEQVADAAHVLTVDRGLVTRVLENLASNAVRHTPRGARVRLEAGVAQDGAHLLAVRNAGTPIPPELRARIFDKYGQGEGGLRSGWGLGLYFCRLAVSAHGGTITVEDAPGWGTSFVVRLPAATVDSPGVSTRAEA